MGEEPGASSVTLNLRVGPTIGKGTSGEVSRLLEAIDGGSYVVKRVPLKSADDGEEEEEQRKRDEHAALQEVRLHRLVSAGCTSIVRYAFASVAGSELLVCMEACDIPLWDALTGEGDEVFRRLSVGSRSSSDGHGGGNAAADEALRSAVTMELSAAVRHCHSLRVLHRDINPWNILLVRHHHAGVGSCDRGPALAAKLGDFGLAAQLPEGSDELSGLEAPGAVPLDESALGSLYSAPELGKTYSFPADVFSLGMTLLALWLAASCKDEDALLTVTEAAKQAATDGASAPAAASINGHADLVAQMLRSSPGERPSAAEICRRVAIKSGPRSPQPPPPSPPHRPPLAENEEPPSSGAKPQGGGIGGKETREDIERCFRSAMDGKGGGRRVRWSELCKVILACGFPEPGVEALEAVWGHGPDGALDYVHFLDWLFDQDQLLA